MSRKNKQPQPRGETSAPPAGPAPMDTILDALQQHILTLSKLLAKTKCPVCKDTRKLHMSGMDCPMCPQRDEALKAYRELYDEEGNPR